MYSEEVIFRAGTRIKRQISIITGDLELNLADKATMKPLSRAQLSMVLEEEAGNAKPTAWRDLPSYRRVTARNGSAAVRDLKIGTYLLSISGRDLVEAVLKVYVQIGENSQDIQVAKKAPAATKNAGTTNGNK